MGAVHEAAGAVNVGARTPGAGPGGNDYMSGGVYTFHTSPTFTVSKDEADDE